MSYLLHLLQDSTHYYGHDEAHFPRTLTQHQNIPKETSTLTEVTENCDTISVSSHAEKITGVYDYARKDNGHDDEYDYESPYWEPADKKTELLSQFRKLKIKSVAQKDIE